MLFFALSLSELLQPKHWMDQEEPGGNYLRIKGGSHFVYTKNVFSSLPENVSDLKAEKGNIFIITAQTLSSFCISSLATA